MGGARGRRGAAHRSGAARRVPTYLAPMRRLAPSLAPPLVRPLVYPLALAAFAVATPVPAQEAAIRTYPVTGSTYAELLASMRENGPLAERTGRRHFGVTEVSFRQSFDYQRARGRCELLGADITLDMTIVLPEWTERDGASTRTVERFERLYDDIVRHEERHAAIARDYLGRLRGEMDRPVTARSCSALEAGLRASSKAVLDRHRCAQLAFDEVFPDEC